MQLCVIKRLSMDRLTAAIMRTHEDNGCCSPLSWDSFRKSLAVAVRQLGFILQRCDNMAELGADDYPSGLLAECGGCWFAGQAGEVHSHLHMHGEDTMHAHISCAAHQAFLTGLQL